MTGGAVGTGTVPFDGPVYPFKGNGGSGPPTAHMICGQSGGGTAHYRLIQSI